MINEEMDIQLKMLVEFEKQLIDMFNYYSEEFDFDKFKANLKWFMYLWGNSRIDIKNKGTESNSLRIYNNEIKYDKDLKINHPAWFKNETGEGTVIKYSKEKLNISFQSIKNGKLVIFLRGEYYKNLNQERVPIYVNYRKVSLNYDNFLDKSLLIYHDEPHVISLRSRNYQRFNLEIESRTIYHYFPKLRTFFKNIKDEEGLMEEYLDILNVISYEMTNLKKKISENEKLQSNKNKSKDNISIRKPKIAMFGSCVSIDPFRSCFNNYKSDFEKKYEHQRSTIISLMSPKIEYEDDDLNYLKDTSDKRIVNVDIRKDFNKEIFKHLDNIDYLIINLVHDVRWGVLKYKDTYITNTVYIPHTKFYENNKKSLHKLNMQKNPREYFELWKKSCDEFFEYISENYPNLKVILQKIELIDHYLSFDGSYKVRKDFHKHAVKLNPFFKQLESYMEENHDVYVIPFPFDTCGDEGHIWGVYSTHYTKTYYEYVYDKIKIIALEDQIKELSK